MQHLKLTIGILIVLSASRFIPHPPNFTSLIALSFYVPAIFGLKFLPFVLLSFIFTDIVIGFHNTMLFTWGSVLLIGFLCKYFTKNIYTRVLGALSGALLFFIISNFGIWINGAYGYSLSGFLTCYILAIPFFVNTFISTLLYSAIIETIYKLSMNYLIKNEDLKK